MHDTCRCSNKSRSRRSAAAGSTRCSSTSATAATSPACTATSTPSPHRTEEMTGDDRRPGARIPGAPAASPTLDITGGAPELNPHFRALVTRGARAGRAGDGPLQPHHLRSARPGGPRRIPRRASRSRSSPRCRAISKTTSTASAARACSTARSARLQRLNALGYGRDGSGLMLNLVYNPQGPSLPPPQAALEADYKRVLGEQLRHRVQPLFTLANMPIQRFGSTLISKGEFDSYLGAAAARASRRQPRRRDVPQPHLGRLARLCLRLRLQPDARPAAARWRTRRACTCRDLLDADLDGNADPRRRPLLRLHRRPGLELRRRAERGGGIARSACRHASVHHRAGARRGGAASPQRSALAPFAAARRRGDRRRRRQPRRTVELARPLADQRAQSRRAAAARR